MSGARLVAVLGYSNGARDGLHPVCAARLERAAREATQEDVVLLSGWARGRRPDSEAALMARSWDGRVRRVVLDHGARTTLGNVRAVATTARELEAREVVLVTSSWHGRRALLLLRAALRGGGGRIALAATDERGSVGARLREIACWTVVPVQAALAARRR